MTKIKQIERQETKMLVEETLKVLQKAMNKHGVTVEQASGAKFGGHNMTLKLEFKVPALASENAKKDYDQYKELYDIKAPYGFAFSTGGKTYRITGLNHKASKNRVLLECDETGRRAHCPVRTVNWEYDRSELPEMTTTLKRIKVGS